MDVMGNNIDTALAALEVKGSGSEDEGNTESSCFKDSLLLGKERLEIYWLKITKDMPYYYAAVILHPNMKLGWFKQHWAKYERRWITMVETGMTELVKSFTEELEGKDEVEVELPRLQPGVAPEAVRPRREVDKELGILPYREVDAFKSSLEVTPQYSNRTLNKRTRVDSELAIHYRYEQTHLIEDPLTFWIKKSQEPNCPFLGFPWTVADHQSCICTI